MKIDRMEKGKDNKPKPSVKDMLEHEKSKKKSNNESNNLKNTNNIDANIVQATAPFSLLDGFDTLHNHNTDHHDKLISASLHHLEYIGIDIKNIQKYDDPKEIKYLNEFQLQSLEEHKKLLNEKTKK